MKAALNSLTSTGHPEGETQPDSSPVFSESPPIDAEIRSRMIADGAYYRAEARGFATGYELEDWLAAEAEVDRSIDPSELDDGEI